jgi:nucleoside-diphosphate-sugar epimerase
MAKVLITGSNGFLGSHITKRMIAEGHEVFCLVRNTSNLARIEGVEANLVYGEIAAQTAFLPAIVDEMDYIFHTAAAIKAKSREQFFKINVIGTINLLEACLKANRSLKRFVFISSQAAGRPSRDGTPAKESDPPQPVSDYGWSKMEAEKAVRGYFDRLPITIIRPPAIYGPGDESFLPVFKLLKKGISLSFGKEKVLNLSYVEDIVDGVLLAALNDKAAGEIFNIAPQQAYNWNDIQHQIAKILQVKPITLRIPKCISMLYAHIYTISCRIKGSVPFTTPSKMREMLEPSWVSDTTKARQILGYKAKHTLEEGVKKTIEDYTLHRSL